MEYVVIGLLVVLIILVIILIIKSSGSNSMVAKMGKLETGIVKEIGDFKLDFSD